MIFVKAVTGHSFICATDDGKNHGFFRWIFLSNSMDFWLPRMAAELPSSMEVLIAAPGQSVEVALDLPRVGTSWG